jgi:hypothetical protein
MASVLLSIQAKPLRWCANRGSRQIYHGMTGTEIIARLQFHAISLQGNNLIKRLEYEPSKFEANA